MVSVDVTDQTTIYGIDGEYLAITQCACGKRYDAWDFNLIDDPDILRSCSGCNRQFYFKAQFTVYEVVEAAAGEIFVSPNELSDRELSVLVGEKLMGWQPGTLDEYRRQVAERGEGDTAFDWFGLLTYMPDYAGDIAAAWELVESFRLVVRPTVTGRWCAAVLFSGGGRVGCSTVEETYVEAKTAARAICLAALKAEAIEAAAAAKETS